MLNGKNINVFLLGKFIESYYQNNHCVITCYVKYVSDKQHNLLKGDYLNTFEQYSREEMKIPEKVIKGKLKSCLDKE